MSDPTVLQEAQQLITDLQQKIETLTLAGLKAQLAQLGDLLGKATSDGHMPAAAPAAGSAAPAAGGNNAEAEELRQKLDTLASDAASFNSMMVHEIRKPMTSIRGYADMLAKPGMIGPLNEMQQNFIDTIRTNVIRMEGLVSDISDISKLNYGRIKLDNKMTTFGQVVMDAQKQLEPVVAEFQPTVLNWEVPQGLPILTVDAKQLAKVVVNLTKNAVQYTPKGGTVTVKAEKREPNILHISVTDTGIGMKPEEIARLGEAFYRADAELVTSQKGYGLGIPVAMGFLKLMESKLDVQSTPGQGSTFSFDIKGMS